MPTLQIIAHSLFSPEVDHIARLIRLADKDDPETQEALAFLLVSSTDRSIQGFREDLTAHLEAYGGADAEIALLRRRQFGRLANGAQRVGQMLAADESGSAPDQILREVLAVACSLLSGRVSDPYISRTRAKEVVDDLDDHLRRAERPIQAA